MRKIASRQTSFRSAAVLAAIRVGDLSCAETEDATVRLLARPLLTIGWKRNSAALSRGFRSVAGAELNHRLPLGRVAD